MPVLLLLLLPEEEKVDERPLRGCSSNPSKRIWKNRFRHLLTICRGVSNREAIMSFDRPCAANKTIFARITSLYGDVYFFESFSKYFRSLSLRVMLYGLFLGIILPPSEWYNTIINPLCQH